MLPNNDVDREPSPVEPEVDWWTALARNKRLAFLILAVQSNAMIMGVEYSLQGTVLGIESFLRLMGHETAEGWAIDSDVMATWSALWCVGQVTGLLFGG
jgi:hypothetical protein